jgi:uncharacterized protein
VLGGLRAAMLVGPRASGKTTTARRYARSVVRLDRDREAQPFRDDPDDALRSIDSPVLLDEWQRVPGVLGAVKRALDDRVPGATYLLTGSVRAELLESSWAATGRVPRLTQWGLVEREIAGLADNEPLFDWLLARPPEVIAQLHPTADPPTLRTYVDLALRGTFPDVALQPNDRLRRTWLSAYVDQLVRQDARLADEHRDPVRLRRYLSAVAASTAGIVEHKTLYDAAGITRATALAYDTVLELLFVVEQVPSWHSNRLNRLTRAPKRYLADTALLRPLANVDTRQVMRDGDLLGRVIDTFVMSQLRPEAALTERGVTLNHLRLEDGRREVDLIAESADGAIIGIEVKANAAPTIEDARHLVWLRDKLPDQFHLGIVFHTGPRTLTLDEKVLAMPIATLWADRSSM